MRVSLKCTISESDEWKRVVLSKNNHSLKQVGYDSMFVPWSSPKVDCLYPCRLSANRGI